MTVDRHPPRRPNPIATGLIAAAILAAGAVACSEDSAARLKDGHYAAEAAEFDAQGWQEYLIIHVSDGLIVSAEYDSRNSSGFPRSWDMADMRRSVLNRGFYHNQYARAFTEDLLKRQDPAQIVPLPGTARLCEDFRLLAEAALGQARAGDRQTASVRLPDRKSPE